MWNGTILVYLNNGMCQYVEREKQTYELSVYFK